LKNSELGVIGEYDKRFESNYLDVRAKENRVYSNEKVALLPYLLEDDAHSKEWYLRSKTLERFLPYLSSYHASSSLLEVGCGNGWFSHYCSQHVDSVIGIDVNMLELQQAVEVFKRENLSFYYWDIFNSEGINKHFDLIVLNAVVQYFPDFNELMSRLKKLLNKNGEIHLLDSPFYKKEELEAAKIRSDNYFNRMGVPKMSSHYFHHNIDVIKDFDLLFRPSRNRLLKLVKKEDSPFYWYRYKI